MGWFDDAVKSVASTVSNAASTVGNAWDSTRENFERSDVGRAVSTFVQPVTSTLESGKDVVNAFTTGNYQDNLGRIANRTGGTLLQTVNPAIQYVNAFGAVENIARTNDFTRTWADAGGVAKSLQSGNNLTGSQALTLAEMYAKEGAIAGAIYGGATYGAAAGNWIIANPVTSTVLGSQLYNATKTGDYSAFGKNALNQVAPGLGNLIPPGSRQTPVDSGYTDVAQAPVNAVSRYSIAGLDTKTMIALGVAAIIFILFLFKKLR